ncbi:HD-GYP domain-containing protein [Rhizobium sp. ZW T2_16]|uniref:HD-GYP domain-containing protein n=1 Tax=Rhizobium sp. ZW T2_16 TaxID=3378083 RepID=UPI000FA03B7A
MILRLPKNLVQPGLFIESVECPSSEFSRRRFMLDSEEDMKAILHSSATDILVSRQKSRIDATALLERAPPRYAKLASLDKPTATHTDRAVDYAMTTMRQGVTDMVSGRVDMEQITQSAASARRAVEAAPDLFMQVTRLKTKDKGTYLHSVSVAGLMAQMAVLLEFDEALVDEIGRAGILHDLGKLLIPNAILNKPGELNAAEKRVIRNHPEIGYRHMKKLGGVSDLILDVCRLHHEALDGSGYPLGLKAEQIGTAVRICTVCDVFDALTTVRPYKKAWSTTEALTWMYDKSNLFDRKLVLRLGSMFR